MSKDNRTNPKAHHRQHSDNQQPKRKRSLIGFISVVACLIILLLVTSCQPNHAKTFTKSEVISHD